MAAIGELNGFHNQLPKQSAHEPAAGMSSVLRALDLIELVAEAGREIGVTELAARSGMHKSSVSRVMATLASRGYARQNPATGRYALGMHLVELGAASLAQVELRQQARPFVEQLCEATGETVHLAEMIDDSIVYIDKAESEHVLTMRSRVGSSVPLHCTGLGKALCAYLPQDFVLRCLDRTGMVRYQPNTITTRDEFLACLAQIRERGYAIDDEEHEEGIRCVAVPILDCLGRAIAAISVSGPTVRLSHQHLHEIAPLVTSVGKAISRAMGLKC
jgi:IclR family KDG regulon transcriptional repressor